MCGCFLVWYFSTKKSIHLVSWPMWPWHVAMKNSRLGFGFAHGYLWCTSVGLSKWTSNVVGPAAQIKFRVLLRHNWVPMWSWVQVSLNPFLGTYMKSNIPLLLAWPWKFWVQVHHSLGPTWQNYYLSKLTLQQEDDSEMRCAWQQGGTHEKSQYNLDGHVLVKCHLISSSRRVFEDAKRQLLGRETSTCYVKIMEC